MKIGMLWFDNDPGADLETKLSRAANYYEKKHGQAPDICYLHPGALKDRPPNAGKLELVVSRSILPNHFWIGVEDTGRSEEMLDPVGQGLSQPKLPGID